MKLRSGRVIRRDPYTWLTFGGVALLLFLVFKGDQSLVALVSMLLGITGVVNFLTQPKEDE